MVRDGRATVHSYISIKVTITGFDLTNYRQCMQKWNQAITTMFEQCKEIGENKCLIVHYEQLVMKPNPPDPPNYGNADVFVENSLKVLNF